MMKNSWKKKGLIFNVDGKYSWNKTHAQVPIVDVLEDRLRIYYSTRNNLGKSNISFIEVDKENPKNILYKHNTTLLDFGEIGSFDDSGLMPTSILNVGNKKYLYYIGWTTRETVPFSNAIGVAVSKDGGKSFKKIFLGPVLGVGPTEPFFTGTCNVIKYKNNYMAYYLSCIGWKKINNKPEPFYDIKIAKSKDGLDWKPLNKVAIKLNSNEGGIASASVIEINNMLSMWFSVRSGDDYRENPLSSYKIGFAESIDGLNWERKENNILSNNSEQWENIMKAYPNVIKLNNSLLLFYNGNGFGQTGFGYAELKLL